jgi:hypothetical protein
MMPRIVARFSTLSDLEEATLGLRPGNSVQFKFVVGSCTLREAATIYRRLQALVGTKGGWEVDKASTNILQRSAEHYEELDVLDLCLELIELDLKDAVPMKKMRFDGVRATANAVVATADASTALDLLDDFVIECQRLARVARGLGFGREDVEVGTLTQEDLVWLMADGAGALVLASDGVDVLADGDSVEMLADGDSGGVLADVDGAEVPADVHIGEVFADVNSSAGLVDGAEVLTGGKVLAGVVDVEKALAGLVDGAEVLTGGKMLAGVVDSGGMLADVDGAEVPTDVHIGEVLADVNSSAGLVDGAEVLTGGKVLAGVVDVEKALAGDGIEVLEVGYCGGAKVLAGSVHGAEALADSVDVAGVGGPLLLADRPLVEDQDVKEDIGGDCDGSGPPGDRIVPLQSTPTHID